MEELKWPETMGLQAKNKALDKGSGDQNWLFCNKPLEGMACYAGQLLDPAEGFGQGFFF